VHCAALDSATITEAYLQAIAWTSEASKSLAV
jgi:uncharacterized protein